MPKKKKNQFRALTVSESAELAPTMAKPPPRGRTSSNEQEVKANPLPHGHQDREGRTFSKKAKHQGQDELSRGPLPPDFHRLVQYYGGLKLKELKDLARERKIGVHGTRRRDLIHILAWGDFERLPLGLLRHEEGGATLQGDVHRSELPHDEEPTSKSTKLPRHEEGGATLQGDAYHSELPHDEEPASKSTNEVNEIGPDGGGIPWYRPGDRGRLKAPNSGKNEAWKKHRDHEIGEDGIMERCSPGRIRALEATFACPSSWKSTADSELQPTFEAGYDSGYDSAFNDAVEELDGGALQSRTEHLKQHFKEATEEDEMCAVAVRDGEHGYLRNADQGHDEGQEYSSNDEGQDCSCDDEDHDYFEEEEQREESWSRYTDKVKPYYEDAYDRGRADGRNTSTGECSLHPSQAGHDDGFNDEYYQDDYSESDHDEDY
jgi:hypothetical protein